MVLRSLRWLGWSLLGVFALWVSQASAVPLPEAELSPAERLPEGEVSSPEVLPEVELSSAEVLPEATQSGRSSRPEKLERYPWASVGLGLALPSFRNSADALYAQNQLIPAGMLSFTLGAGWGSVVVGARLEFGFGGLRSRNDEVTRGIGYVLAIGPSLRASLYQGAVVGVALVGDASFWHVGTAAESLLEEGRSYPQLGMQALAPGAALQFTGRTNHFLFELRYQRQYWFRATDEAYASSFRGWDFMPTDQWLVSVGGFVGRASPRK